MSARTAYHEAGHAVIGRRMGLVCGGATIVANEDEGEAGHAICADPWVTVQAWDDAGRWRDYGHALLGRIITYMAGAETERLIYGDCAGGDIDDRRQIDRMAEALGWDGAMKLERLRTRTLSLCRKHQPAIERVQMALMMRRVLTGAEIDAIVGQ